jgi:hypothetical protein
MSKFQHVKGTQGISSQTKGNFHRSAMYEEIMRPSWKIDEKEAYGAAIGAMNTRKGKTALTCINDIGLLADVVRNAGLRDVRTTAAEKLCNSIRGAADGKPLGAAQLELLAGLADSVGSEEKGRAAANAIRRSIEKHEKRVQRLGRAAAEKDGGRDPDMMSGH